VRILLLLVLIVYLSVHTDSLTLFIEKFIVFFWLSGLDGGFPGWVGGLSGDYQEGTV
jgi:hypothetical protein